MYNRATMKREVKQIIAGMRPRPMWVTLLYMVISSVGASLLQSIVGFVSGSDGLLTQISELAMSGRDPEAIVGDLVLMYGSQIVSFIGTLIFASLITSVLATLWQGVMTVGFNGYCLAMVKGENPTPGRIFCAFPMFGKVVLTGLLLWIFTTLWTLLYVLILGIIVGIGAFLLESVMAVGIILMVLGYILFLFLMVRLTLRYAMTYYFILDEGKFGLEAITASKQMMKGKKGKLFMLYLSFIGWFLLQFAITLVGVSIIAVISAMGAASLTASIAAVGSMVGGVLFVGLVTAAATWLISMWLQPYITGSVAKFYLSFKPQAPVENAGWPTLGDTTVSGGTADYE